jgi:N-acetyl-1-D-myo-inositol-2-amino-2-deoxy-alpha-D-glucopyranoside deacetylase
MTGAVVAVVAHPDDESLIAGGTLALAAAAGAPTGIVSLTRGEHGPISDAALATRGQLGKVRAQELEAAARELGAGWARCLRYPDGELPWIDHDAASLDLATLLEGHAPAVVLTFGDDGLYGHPDHAAARDIAALAIQRLGTPIDLHEAAWPTGVMKQLVGAASRRGLPVGLWGLEAEAFGCDRAPTIVIDVRPVLAKKLAALRAHRTQLGFEHLLTALPDDLAERFLATEPWTGPDAGTLRELIGGG